MMMFIKAASVFGSLLVVIALVIALLKTLITFVGFVALAIKIVIFLAFIGLFAAVGFMVFRTWQHSQKRV